MQTDYLFRKISKKYSSKSKAKIIFYTFKFLLKLSMFPPFGWINSLLIGLFNIQLASFVRGSLFLSKFKKCGKYPRVGIGTLIYYPNKITLGNNVSIGNYVIIYNESDGEEINIGSNTHIADFSLISGVGGLEIGENNAISSGVKIYSHSNDYKDKNKLIRTQLKKGKVTIRNNVLTGANVVILPGVMVGSNSVIGAGAVVTKNVKTNCIAVGVPAKSSSK